MCRHLQMPTMCIYIYVHAHVHTDIYTYPEGPSTQHLRTLVPNTSKGMVFRTRDLKYWVLGPSEIDTDTRLGCGRSQIIRSGDLVYRLVREAAVLSGALHVAPRPRALNHIV